MTFIVERVQRDAASRDSGEHQKAVAATRLPETTPAVQAARNLYNVSKLSRAERREGTGSAYPDDIAAVTCLQARSRRRDEMG
ncbi:MAG: hypothetical protein ACJAYU_001365 [Bradymonadia bacterium]|jgi:hypothetical protein